MKQRSERWSDGVCRLMLAGLVAGGVAGCERGGPAEGPAQTTAFVERGDLRISAEATGNVEPVLRMEVKSKASGEVFRLHVDVGDEVTRGTLLAEIDPRDVQNNFDQVQADLVVAEQEREISRAQLDRQLRLAEAGVITQQDLENARLSDANSEARLIRARTNMTLAQLQLQDVRITAPVDGTILTRLVEEGTVIQSASQNVSGGSVLFTMADLSLMQVRTLVDETDMGSLQAGFEAAVRVEAYRERVFPGVVEKIEPEAVNQSNVTMFPVIVRLDNRERLLRPGMNSEVEILIDEARDVLLVPNNAIVDLADVAPAAAVLGLNPDELDLSAFQAGNRFAAGGGRPGRGGGDPTAAAANGNGEPPQARRGGGGGWGAPQTRFVAVFVLPDSLSAPEPRVVEIGLNDWDRTQIVSGLEEGDRIAIVGAAQLLARQQESLDRFRDRGGNNPFGGNNRGGRGR